MREFDRVAIEEYGIPSMVLMENAALRVVEFLEAKFSPLSEKKIVILCGKGNNGGDGLAIARHLKSICGDVAVFLACAKSDLRGDAALQLRALETAIDLPTIGLNLVELQSHDDFHGEEPDLILDALLGTGFQGELVDERLLLALQFLRAEVCPKIAVDLPSGLNAQNGEAPKKAARTDFTVTFAAPKIGFFVREGVSNCGEIWVGDIGSFEEQMWETSIEVDTLAVENIRRLSPCRAPDAHKGDAGRVLIIGGSVGMSGAVALSAKSALASGCGLCIAAIPSQILPTFAASILEATSHPLPCDESGKLIERAVDELPALWKNVEVVALGPGLGRSDETFNFVRRVARECPKPLVVDADALHALPAIVDEIKNREAPTILTPHPGEMGELMGMSAREVNESRFETVAACAQKYGAIVVLKGARSLVALPDGNIFVNLTGNAGMATGGSGDVLTGTIAGLLAQLKNAESATNLGVYLHGFAGDIAARTRGNGLVAGDIAGAIPAALLEIGTREVERINGRLRKLE